MAFKSNALLWEKSPLIRLILPFIGGIILYDQTAFALPREEVIIILLLSTMLLFLVISFFCIKTHRFKFLQFLAAQFLLFFLGLTACYLQGNSQHKYDLVHQSDSLKYTLATIAAEPTEKNKTIKFELDILKTAGEKTVQELGAKAFVYLYKNGPANKLQTGDTIIVPSHWQKITNTGNPFEMNYQKYCARKNIFFRQFLAPEQMVLYGKIKPQNISLLRKTHQYCVNTINATIKDSTANALLKAMLVGDERDIDPITRQAYSDTGIIHIISVSGAHVALLFFAISFCLRWLGNQKHAWIKYALSLALVWFYVVLAGASTPALRAAIMFTILAIGNMAGKQSNPINQLLSAAFIMLLIQPMWLFTIGFQLSFIAVLSLIIFYPPIVSVWQPQHKITQFFVKTIAASIAAEILVAPLVAYYFHSFPPMFIVANVVASAAMGAILGLGMLLLLIGKFVLAAKGISSCIILFSQWFHYCIYALQWFNIDALKSIFLSFTGLILLYMAIISGSIFILYKKKPAVWLALSSLFLFSLLVFSRSLHLAAQQKLIVYNISKEAHSELLTGNSFTVLSGNDTESYAIKNAHIGFGITRKQPAPKQQLLLLNNKRILVMDSNTHTTQAFPVDILVVSAANKYLDANLFISAFHPAKIIISNNQSKWQVKEWEEKCALHHIALHNTRKDGAFIFP